MQDARDVKRAERADKLEARQCVSCGRWFTLTKAARVICRYCETDGQSPGREGQAKAGGGGSLLAIWGPQR